MRARHDGRGCSAAGELQEHLAHVRVAAARSGWRHPPPPVCVRHGRVTFDTASGALVVSRDGDGGGAFEGDIALSMEMPANPPSRLPSPPPPHVAEIVEIVRTRGGGGAGHTYARTPRGMATGPPSPLALAGRVRAARALAAVQRTHSEARRAA